VAFSCKGRGVCPSCNTRRMAQTAAHLADHVLPRLAVRQWVLSAPKRLRYYLQRDGAALNTALRIFLRVIQGSLHQHCPGAAQVDKAALRIGAVAFIHRFGSSLNTHVHFHVCVVDGVFEVGEGAIFHPASGLDETAVVQVQGAARTRILRAFVGRGLIESFEAKEMLAYQHSGFSVFRSMRACAFSPLTAQAWSDSCATARAHRFRWNDCASASLPWCRRRAPTGTATSACWHRIRH